MEYTTSLSGSARRYVQGFVALIDGKIAIRVDDHTMVSTETPYQVVGMAFWGSESGAMIEGEGETQFLQAQFSDGDQAFHVQVPLAEGGYSSFDLRYRGFLVQFPPALAGIKSTLVIEEKDDDDDYDDYDDDDD